MVAMPTRPGHVRAVVIGGLLTAVGATVACGASTTANQGTANPGTATAPDDGLVDIGAGLRGRAGLTASVYTTGPADLGAFAVDGAGRLWLATAAFEDAGTDVIAVVPDPGNGSGAESVTVLDGLHTPLGLAWVGDTLYVAAEESVTAYSGLTGLTGLTGTSATGGTGGTGPTFADRRTVVQFAPGVGEVNGIVAGPDGRLVVGISAPCNACVPEQEESGAVVSFRPDGTDLRVDARNLRAPIDLAYVPGTDDLLATANLRDDLGDATPGDWLVHIEPGQDWGSPDCTAPTGTSTGTGGDPCAGVPAPVAVLDPHAAVSGLAVLAAPPGEDGTDRWLAVVAEWQPGLVQQVELTATPGSNQDAGTPYRGAVSPLVAGIEHPKPVIALADGSVLVGDWETGTVYRITGIA